MPDTCRILVSPADRAQQTALALHAQVQDDARARAGARPRRMLAAANWPDAREPVLIVGHQPTLGKVAALLLGRRRAPNGRCRKGAVWWLSNRDARDAGRAVVLRVVIVAGFPVTAGAIERAT